MRDSTRSFFPPLRCLLKVSPAYNDFTENVLKLFACAQEEHMKKHGTPQESFVQIAYKNHKVDLEEGERQ